MGPITVAILTISDRCSRNEAVDESGPCLAQMINNGILQNSQVAKTDLVPDEIPLIQEKLIHWSDECRINVILTTGGTGFSSRDVTPGATNAILDKQTPGITNLIFKKSLEITPLAALSRMTSGIRKKSLIINFPGSKKAAKECLEAIAKVIPHAVDLIVGVEESVKKVHSDLSESKVDGKKIANRNRQSIFPLLSVKNAQEIIKAEVNDLKKETVVSLDNALGYILAEDVTAKDPLPPFRASIKDGYAVVSSDTAITKKVIGASTAGDNLDLLITPGFCARISTGACVPSGADAVIQIEDTYLVQASDDGETEIEVGFKTKPKPGQDIRQPGSDIKVGEIVLSKGTYLGSCELGVLAAVGVCNVKVYAKPIIGVMSTGNEVQNPGEVLQPGKIRDSNRTTLINLLKEHGYTSVDVGIVPDDLNILFKALKTAFESADVLITTGSVSMGEKDYLKQIFLTDFSANIHFGRVQMKPGKPTSFATFTYKNNKKFWFGLPGNPVSAAVTCQLFVLPALKIFAGWEEAFPARLKAKLTEDIKLDERPEYRRAVITYKGEEIPYASTTGNQISSRLLSCVGANCLLELPSSSDVKILEKNSIVNALIIQKLFE